MTLQTTFNRDRANLDLSRSATSLTDDSFGKSLSQDRQLSSLSLHKSSAATVSGLRASRRDAISIRRSGFRDSARVGRRENDPRYYRFTLRRRGSIDISIQNREAGGFFGFFTPTLQVRLEQSNGRSIRKKTVEGGEFEHLTRRLNQGTYYIRVTSKGESVPFRLGLRSRSGSNLFR